MSDAILHAPTEFVYEIKKNSYRADNRKFCNYKVIDCTDMEVVYRGPGVDCLCRKGLTEMWLALIYHTTDEQRQAFDQLFERCGVEIRDVSPDTD